MNLKSIKFNKKILKDTPFLFERYEIFVIVLGVAVVFLLAGFIFYEKAYKTASTVPDIEIEVTRVKAELFEKTIQELEQRKQMAPDLPIIDPFR